MKKYSIRSILLLLLVVSSLSSYVFLNTVSSSNTPNNGVTEIEETTSQQIVLPDIELVKKLVEVGKTVLIRSSNR